MLYSMTGYGQEQYEADEVSFLVEIKTVNNRYLKTSIRLPEAFAYAEIEIERLIKESVNRGTVNYFLHMKQGGNAAALNVDHAAVTSYLNHLDQIATFAGKLNLNTRVDLATLLSLYGSCQAPELTPQECEDMLQIVMAISRKAIAKLQTMRLEEGRALQTDLETNCQVIRTTLNALSQLTDGVVINYRNKLVQRANELLSGVNLKLTEEDVLKEVAIFAERCDINEEILRLGSHLDQFKNICDNENQAGRKLDFLTQEMLREANTIASKANDARISQSVVDIKVAIDRLREQVQNIE